MNGSAVLADALYDYDDQAAASAAWAMIKAGCSEERKICVPTGIAVIELVLQCRMDPQTHAARTSLC